MTDVSDKLLKVRGLAVRQVTQIDESIAQSMGIPLEQRNKYRIMALPSDKAVKSEPKDKNGWEPTSKELESMETWMWSMEESNACLRVCLTCFGIGSFRPLKLHFSVDVGTGDAYVIDRPFKCGGVCCHPREMSVQDNQGKRIGRVREDFSPYLCKCLAAACLCTTYKDIECSTTYGGFEKKYKLRTNFSCCGRVNNCFGGTCLRNDAVFDILDQEGKVVAHMQKTFAGSDDCFNAFCRMMYQYNNYLLEFPEYSSTNDRMLLLAAIFQLDYELEAQGDK